MDEIPASPIQSVEFDYDVSSDSDNDNFTQPIVNVRQAVIVRRNQEPEIDAAVKKEYLKGTFNCNVTHCQNI